MKKKWIILVSSVVLLLVARIILPFIVKDYVNKTLDNLEGYKGSITDVDLNLIRGAYVIDSVKIFKTGDSIPVPFVKIDKIDLSLHWNALFKGAIVGEVILDKPVVNFAVAVDSTAKDSGKVSQDGSGTDWTKPLKELMPLQINRFEITNGKIAYKDFTTNPKVDVFIVDMDLLATNLTNASHIEEKLPSSLIISGKSVGGGELDVSANLNILKQIPDMDLEFKFENADLTAFNDFVRAYAKLDVEEGVFNLYSEVIIKDSNLGGYVKPVIENLKILDWDKEEGNFLQKMWESIAGGLMEIFENQPKDQFATKTPLDGNLENMEVGVWPTVWNIFKNAFVQAFSKKVEGTIDFTNEDKENDK